MSGSLTAIPTASGHFKINLANLKTSLVAMPAQSFDCIGAFKQLKFAAFTANNY
jgi:hypothetical protein